MAKTFEEYKRRRKEISDKVLWNMSYDVPTEKNSEYWKRIMRALSGTEIGRIMKVCMDGARCGSVFCDHCREDKQRRCLAFWREHLRKEMNDDEEVARARLRWVTVVHDVVPLKVSKESQTITCVTNAVRVMKNRVSNIARVAKARGSHLWLNGGIHLEIQDYGMYMFAGLAGMTITTKERLMKELLPLLDKNIDGKVVCVHFHALADLYEMESDEFRTLFVDKWDKHYKQVDITRLDRSRSLKTSLVNMSRYCNNGSNRLLRYSRSWETGKFRYETVEKVDLPGDLVPFMEQVMDRPVDRELSLGDLRMLVEVHNAVNGPYRKGLSIRIH